MNYYDQARTHKSSLVAFLAGVSVALIAGGFYFFGPRGAEHRRSVDRWLKHARYEILQRMEEIEDITEEQYHKIVDDVAARYETMKGYGREKAAILKDTFRRKWSEMKETARQAREEVEAESVAEEEMRLSDRNDSMRKTIS